MATTDLKAQVDNLIRIGIALSSERNIDVLLEMIVDESRRFTQADAGTLFIVSDDGKSLNWKIVQNDTMGTRIGGTSSVEIDEMMFRPVPLVVDGQMNHANVSAYAANSGQTVNIPDVYEAAGFDFRGPREYDAATGYRSQSMLVAPMRNFEDDIIGVLQLLNAKDDPGGEVIPFSSDFEAMTTSLASQAAVAITNARLIDDLQKLFDAFIQTIAAAVDEKSPYTAGHVRRVADLTMRIAEEINRTESGLWGKIRFTGDELTELRLAAWMHDVGKITTPEHVVDKATKLETIHDRIETVRARYEILMRDAEISVLRRRLEGAGAAAPDLALPAAGDEVLDEALQSLREECEFIARCNTGGEFMADEDVARLGEIATRTYQTGGKAQRALTENEVYNLSIRKGTLTAEELGIMHNHAAVSVRMLSQLPFSKKLRRVAEFAGGHHETLNGKGYPGGLAAEALPLQARILAVADIFEALTAPDRPYRKPMPLSLALRIIRENVERGELDGSIVDLFVDSGLVHAYAEQELSPGQIDLEAS